ncbi:MAG: O-antigen ligase family protein [Bacteroidaceae bacterium]|nr:O-antigen ligase family protein [Bacteroidaceae bacterium]
MVNKNNIIFYAAIVLFIVYYLQGIVYPSGNFQSQICLTLYLLIDSYCAFHSLFLERANTLTYTWGTFILMLSFTFLLSPKIVHGTVNEAIGDISTFSQFKESFSLSLTYFIACYVGRNGTIINKHLFFLGVLFFLLAFLRFHHTGITLEQKFDGNIGVTNNAAYCIAVALPFLVFIYDKSKLLAGTLMVLSISLIIIGAKRGAIVCLIVIALFVLLYYFKNTKTSLRKYLIVSLLICSIGWFVNMSYQSNEYLMHRIEKTSQVGIGGREVAYTMLFDHWAREQNPIIFLFGNGTAQTVNIWGNYAHNDWLELLIDNGVLGVCIYMMLFILTYINIYRSELDYSKKIACYCAFIIWLCQSIFSMGYTGFDNAILFLLFGLFLGGDYTEREDEENFIPV